MPKTPAPGDGESTRQILGGIRLIVVAIQDLKREAAEDRKRSDAQFAEYVRHSEARDE